MSNQFAKLYERAGEQVLVVRETDENGAPALTITCNIGWATASPRTVFKDSERGIEARDKAFDEMTEDSAFAVRAKMMEDFGHINDGAEEIAPSRRKPGR